MDTSKSKTAFDEAKKYIPGGVNSPVRAFKNVGTYPLFIERANGSKIYDIDGNEYIDYVGSWGDVYKRQSQYRLDINSKVPVLSCRFLFCKGAYR